MEHIIPAIFCVTRMPLISRIHQLLFYSKKCLLLRILEDLQGETCIAFLWIILTGILWLDIYTHTWNGTRVVSHCKLVASPNLEMSLLKLTYRIGWYNKLAICNLRSAFYVDRALFARDKLLTCREMILWKFKICFIKLQDHLFLNFLQPIPTV